MAANKKKYITEKQFSALIEETSNKNKWSSYSVLEISQLLADHGYQPELRGISFSHFSEKIMNFFKHDCRFAGITFNNCYLPGSRYHNCIFNNTAFIPDDSRYDFDNCLVFADSTVYYSSFKFAAQSANVDSCTNLVIKTYDPKPVLAIIYEAWHGTRFTDVTTGIMKERGLEFLALNSNDLFKDSDPTHTPEHPIFSHLSLLNGILLPGGHNVETDKSRYSGREQLESFMVDLALQHNIPLLGICRGHQFIGHYFGAEIKDACGHVDNHIRIAPIPDSMLYQLAEKKYATQTQKRKPEQLLKKDDGYHYDSFCAHSQGVFFGANPDKRVKITAYSNDNLPESMQVNDNIISFQHHHEYEQRDDFARAVMKKFANMVKDDYATHAQPVLKKREAEELKNTRQLKKPNLQRDTVTLFSRQPVQPVAPAASQPAKRKRR